MSSCLFCFFFLTLFLYTTGDLMCNEDTAYKCKCSQCHRIFETQNNSVIIEFEKCVDPNDLDLRRLRGRVAAWLQEDCAFIIRCPQPFAKLNEQNIIVSEFLCVEGLTNRLGLLGLWNDDSGSAETIENRMDVEMLNSVIFNREHLLSQELRSGLLRVGKGSELLAEHKNWSSEYTWQQLLKWGLGSASLVFTFSSVLILCVAWQIIGWNRLSQGLCWKSQRTKSLRELNDDYRRRHGNSSAGHRDQMLEIPLNQMASR
ncbi:hypothetical protein M3Y98_01078000 [Aphelenchoides besseyi]|nr:hypothetical protein M3Y98_01078000 [Aphelenchoides besseyi]KAI6209545.1 hypothetical protein M3Y96_00232400 [Aphelenchoides besseyi]